MAKWQRGSAGVQQMLDRGELEQIRGAAADGSRLIKEAEKRLKSARSLTEDPAGAFVLAYDAARLACTGLLAQQGLRPTSRGGHIAVERVMNAQFMGGFDDYGWMRRRRNEVEYPTGPESDVSDAELSDAIVATATMVHNAGRLLGSLGFFA